MFGPTVSPQLVQSGRAELDVSFRSANLPQPSMAGAFSAPTWPGPLAFFGQPPKCDVAHTSFRLAPPKSDMATSVWWPGGDTMAPKPEPAGLAYVFGIVLAVA